MKKRAVSLTILCLLFISSAKVVTGQENFNITGHWIEKGKNVYNIMFNSDSTYQILRADGSITKGTYKIDGKVIIMEFESRDRKVKSVYSILKKDKTKFTAKVVTILVQTGQVVQDENVVVSRVFIDNKNGTITDTRTGLMWQQDGKASGELNWQNAMNYCKNLRLAGYSDWRAPTINELKKLFNITVGDGETGSERNRAAYLNNNGFKNVQLAYYWSASTYATNTSYAWNVSMSYGLVYFTLKPDYSYVIAVRSGR
jgi:hypothetical protein